MRYGLSACGAALVGTLVYGRSEIFVLQFHGLKSAAGVFALATGLAGQITVPMDSLMGPLLPTATRVLAADRTRATETAARTVRITSVLGSFTMASAIPAVVVAIPLLFGHRFEPAKSPFILLGLVSCLGSVTLPLGIFIMATRNASSMLRVNVVCLAADASLALGLVPVLGLWGAVIANASAQFLSFSLITIVAVRRVGIEARPVGQACLPMVLGIGATGLALLLVRLVHIPIGAVLVMAPMAGAFMMAIGLRFIPSWRVSATESFLIEDSLPAWLRSPYQRISRIFSIVASVPK